MRFLLSTGQLVAILVIALLTWSNTRGVHYAKLIQNVFTSAKIVALAALILLGFLFWNHTAVSANLHNFWTPHDVTPLTATLSAFTGFGLFAALCVSQSGSLFSADAWHGITFAAGEVKNPAKTLPAALALGTISVMGLYMLANVAYLLVLPFGAIQHAAADRVATAMLQAIFPSWGAVLMAAAIMISTFGCINALVLAGPRVYFSMARDGLFPAKAGTLNRAQVPGTSLLLQGFWACALVLPRTFNSATHSYGSLYSNLLDYVISAELIFLRADDCGRDSPSHHASECSASLSRAWLSGDAANLYCRLHGRARLPVCFPSRDHLARLADRAVRITGLLVHDAAAQ